MKRLTRCRNFKLRDENLSSNSPLTLTGSTPEQYKELSELHIPKVGTIRNNRYVKDEAQSYREMTVNKSLPRNIQKRKVRIQFEKYLQTREEYRTEDEEVKRLNSRSFGIAISKYKLALATRGFDTSQADAIAAFIKLSLKDQLWYHTLEVNRSFRMHDETTNTDRKKIDEERKQRKIARALRPAKRKPEPKPVRFSGNEEDFNVASTGDDNWDM